MDITDTQEGKMLLSIKQIFNLKNKDKLLRRRKDKIGGAYREMVSQQGTRWASSRTSVRIHSTQVKRWHSGTHLYSQC